MREIYSYTAPFNIYAANWSARPDHPYRLAVGSFREEFPNEVSIIQLTEDKSCLEKVAGFEHLYPPSKIQWLPGKDNSSLDILGTASDYLRIWEITDDGVKMKSLLDNSKNSEFCAPLTSFDWNENKSQLVATSSIDTTCTIWDVEKERAVTQLIAHDKEVYDVAFARGVDVFASVGADGSLRMFDLRSLEHSTIIYESPTKSPILRLSWNKQDPNYLAAFSNDNNKTIVLDIRVPSLPAAELGGHTGRLNGISWAPHSSCHLCTASDDRSALIWDLSCIPKPVSGIRDGSLNLLLCFLINLNLDPVLSYSADSALKQLQWSVLQPDWVCIGYNNTVQILRV